jgi:hypothetical protein
MDFDWDEVNEFHLGRHGLTPMVVSEVANRSPQFFLNEDELTGSHIMIGPDERDTIWTVILLDLGEGLWRPITGWRSPRSEIELFQREATK